MKYLILLILFSCHKENFKIKKGNHYSGLYIDKINSNTINVDVLFDSTCIYDLKDSIQQQDVNKLIGFSSCGSLHHVNSARFGWRWFNDRLEIFSYCCVNKVRKMEYITSVSINEWHNYQIIDHENKYEFILDRLSSYVIKDSCKENSRYLLKPFFGGNLKAPQDINIKIKNL